MLTARFVQHAPPGWHCDGRGLYLQCTAAADGSVNRSWVYRYQGRYMGLGPLADVTLAEAREKALAARKLRLEGVDPIDARNAKRNAARLEAAKVQTFKQCAVAYIAMQGAGWRNAKHAEQWKSTLESYVYPVFGHLPVQDVDTGLVLKALEPIWASKTETAGRVRGRIESVLDWAKARNLREGGNPARWRGHLDKLLPSKAKVTKGKHFPALPYNQIADFVGDLRSRPGIAARALELAILCAVRTGDIIGNDRDEKPPMMWAHVDLSAQLWTIPSTKTDTEHQVPLAPAVVRLLTEMQALSLGGIVFPGAKATQPLSNMAMLEVIKRMNADREARGLARYVDPKQGNRDVVPHGFRSTFRDFAGDCTNFQRETIEMALAHAIEDDTESAYRRSTALTKRRKLMAAWAEFCEKTNSRTVVPLRSRA